MDVLSSHPTQLFHGRRWGVWQLDSHRLVLIYIPDGYEIDVEEITSSAQLLDWLFQVYRWTTPQEHYDLMQAFRDTFHPQANLCSGGGDKRIEDPTAFLRERIREGQQ